MFKWNKKTKRVVSTIIVVVIVLAMIIGVVAPTMM